MTKKIWVNLGVDLVDLGFYISATEVQRQKFSCSLGAPFRLLKVCHSLHEANDRNLVRAELEEKKWRFLLKSPVSSHSQAGDLGAQGFVLKTEPLDPFYRDFD